MEKRIKTRQSEVGRDEAAAKAASRDSRASGTARGEEMNPEIRRHDYTVERHEAAHATREPTQNWKAGSGCFVAGYCSLFSFYGSSVS
jgi:hypothetical protein